MGEQELQRQEDKPALDHVPTEYERLWGMTEAALKAGIEAHAERIAAPSA